MQDKQRSQSIEQRFLLREAHPSQVAFFACRRSLDRRIEIATSQCQIGRLQARRLVRSCPYQFRPPASLLAAQLLPHSVVASMLPSTLPQDKDAAFCFYCYLFGQDVGKQGGGKTFVTKGFKLWNQLLKLDSHVGGVNSAYNQAVKKSEDLLKEKQHIQSVLVKQSNQDKLEYRVQLNAIADCIRFLLCRRLAFRGHDESQGSSDKVNFLELLQFLGDHNESINEVLQKAPKNCKLTHHDIQKDIVNTIARETFKAIIMDLDNGFFSILVDESLSGRPRRNTQQNVNLHHYRVELFYTVIDIQLQELNNRFSEANTDLLLCMACLNPSNSFVAFDKEKLIRLAKFYPSDFLGTDILALDSQLQNYIFDMRSNNLFLELQGVSELAEKLVYTKKHETYPLVYLLVKLALTLLVATVTVERSFSAMKYIKNELRNRMGDQWMNDYLVVYIEKDVACSIDNETIMQRFQNIKTRRRQL
ncbi:hypothetical protein SO802_002332 [Lithocarpus litseifolius]|uniref:TTF-type domain-containing protein n=1 Tax=Lithocarpus litseifolius TaxID=425828 RepID=A0AAW2E0K0_9ROSI